MTAPLTPSDCDLRDFQFMPLDIVRLFGSRFHAVATDAEWRAGVTLWLKSFHQVPAGSVPNDDVELCRLAELGRDMRSWKKVRANALHGWILCDDNRFYHPVVCEKAVEAWAKRVSYRERGKKGNEKRWKGVNRQDEPDGGGANGDREKDHNSDASATEEGSPSHRLAIAAASQGTGTGRTKERTIPDGMDADSASPVDEGPGEDDLADLLAMPVAKGSWRLAVKVLTERGKLVDAKARALIGKLKGGGLTDDDLWQIAEAAWRSGTLDPVPYLTKAAEGVLERRVGMAGIDAPSERQQRAWMQDWIERGRASWRTHERGPYPDQPGCRVTEAIRAEFQSEAAA